MKLNYVASLLFSSTAMSSSCVSVFAFTFPPSLRQQYQYQNQYQHSDKMMILNGNNNQNSQQQQRQRQRQQQVVVLQMSGGDGDDEYDDFYADFDPSKFDSYNTDSNYNDSGGGGGYDNDRGGGGGYRGGGGNRDRGRGGQGRGRSFEYSRDTSRDNSNVDEAAVTDLLRRRGEAKKTRNFDQADAIRDELMKDYHIGVDDRELTWRTGVSVSGSGRGRGGRGEGRGRGRGEGRGRGGRGNERSYSRRPRQDFGPNGHDYDMTIDSGPNTSGFSEQEINNMLAERLTAKLTRDFGTADAIQTDLVARGVFVHDGTKEYRFDGVPYGSFSSSGDRRGSPGRIEGSQRSNNRNVAYMKSSFSADLDGGVKDELIDGLVQERLRYKDSRSFEKADAIREGLRTKFNVLIDDRLRLWSVAGDFGEEHNARRELSHQFSNRGYVKSSSSLDISPENEKYIQDQIDERSTAKKDRDFHTADSIRESLLQEFDASIDDKMKLWSIGGAFEETGTIKPRGVYTRRGAMNLSDEDVKNIEHLLMERYKHKKDRNFDAADDIRSQLEDSYDVRIDDRSAEWRIDTDEYAQTGTSNLSKEDTTFVEAQIVERFACKRNRDYDTADEIRDQLRTKFGVNIDDRTKEWTVVPSEMTFVKDDNYYEEKEESESATENVDDEKEEDNELVMGNDEDDKNQEDEDIIGSVEVEEAVEEEEEVEEELLKLTVVALKEKLRVAGLPVSGKKAELVARLLTTA